MYLLRCIPFLIITFHHAESETCSKSVSVTNLDPIQICMVVSAERYQTLGFAKTAIKSVLYYSRHREILFHLIVDEEAKEELGEFFRELDLDRVLVTYYHGGDFLDSVQFVNTFHYSGDFARLKIILPEIIPESADKIIFLDADVMLTTDVYFLLREFRSFTDKTAVAMAEEQSPYYSRFLPNFRVIGRGFNSGVILLSLKRMREYNWTDLLQPITEEEMKKLNRKDLMLPDMSVFNAVASRHPDWFNTLSCAWNVQMSPMATPQELCLNDHLPLLIHYNTPDKLHAQMWEHFPALRKHYDFLNKLTREDFVD